jgi:hypothetical protein
MMFRFALTSLLALSAVGALACDDEDEDPNGPPDTQTFTANLTGAAERPTPVTTTATGTATFTAVTVGSVTTITYSATVTGLSGPATLAHIHGPAGEDAAAGPIVTLIITNSSATSGAIISGSFTATGHATINMATLLQHLENGQAYINVHTAANPDGEIRGQITD